MPSRSASIAAKSLPKSLSRLAVGSAGAVSAFTSAFRFTCRAVCSVRLAVSTTWTSACTFTLNLTGGSGAAPVSFRK